MREDLTQEVEELSREINSNRIRIVRLYCGEERDCFEHSEKVARKLAGTISHILRINGSSPAKMVELLGSLKDAHSNSTNGQHGVTIIDNCDKVPQEMIDKIIESNFDAASPQRVIIFTAKSRNILPPRLLASCYYSKVAGLNQY